MAAGLMPKIDYVSVCTRRWPRGNAPPVYFFYIFYPRWEKISQMRVVRLCDRRTYGRVSSYYQNVYKRKYMTRFQYGLLYNIVICILVMDAHRIYGFCIVHIYPKIPLKKKNQKISNVFFIDRHRINSILCRPITNRQSSNTDGMSSDTHDFVTRTRSLLLKNTYIPVPCIRLRIRYFLSLAIVTFYIFKRYFFFTKFKY